MKNRLSDLNNHLFAQMERLTDEDLSPEKLEQEVKRTDAMVAVSEQIIRNADTVLKAAALAAEHGGTPVPMLTQLIQQPATAPGSTQALDYRTDTVGGRK